MSSVNPLVLIRPNKATCRAPTLVEREKIATDRLAAEKVAPEIKTISLIDEQAEVLATFTSVGAGMDALRKSEVYTLLVAQTGVLLSYRVPAVSYSADRVRRAHARWRERCKK